MRYNRKNLIWSVLLSGSLVISAGCLRKPLSAEYVRALENTPAATKGDPKAKVWVVKSTGKYYCSNASWFGKSRNGEFMLQEDAQNNGYRPAKGNYCK